MNKAIDKRLTETAVAQGVVYYSEIAPLYLVTGSLFVPFEHAQKLLQRAGRHAGRVGDRLDALAVQVAQLTRNVRDRKETKNIVVIEIRRKD